MKRRMNGYLLAGLIVTGLMAALILVGLVWTPYDPDALLAGPKLEGPSLAHWLGTDSFGRDIFSRVLQGAGTTFLIALSTVAIGAVCGHLWPVWFGFKGGKGVAVAAGAILASEPVVLLALAVVFFSIAFASRIVSLASVTVAILYPIFTGLYSWYTGRNILFTTLCALVMGVLVIWMHRANIQRLLNGTEYRFGEKKK